MLLKGLPIYVKCQIINTRLFSRVLYLMNHNPPSDETLAQLQDFAEQLIFEENPTKRNGIKQLYVPREMGGFGLIHLRKMVFPRLAHQIAALATDDGSSPSLLQVRTILQHQSLKIEMPKPEPEPWKSYTLDRTKYKSYARSSSGSLFWKDPTQSIQATSPSSSSLPSSSPPKPRARAMWTSVLANRKNGFKNNGLSSEWHQSQLSRALPPIWARRLHAWREVTSPSDGKYLEFENWAKEIGGNPKFFDVREPLGLSFLNFNPPVAETDDVGNLFSQRYTKKQAMHQSKVVVPSWIDHYPELNESRWSANWRILKSVPIYFSQEVETYHFLCLRFYNAGTVGWPQTVPDSQNPSIHVELPNNKEECSLCGQELEDFDHLFTRCQVSLRLVRSCLNQNSTPSFVDLLCPQVLASQIRWNRNYLRWMLYLATIIKWARSRRANRDLNLETPPKAKDFEKIRQTFEKKLGMVEWYLSSRKRRE